MCLYFDKQVNNDINIDKMTTRYPTNTEGVFCYYNHNEFVLKQRSQTGSSCSEYIVIDRKKQSLVLKYHNGESGEGL